MSNFRISPDGPTVEYQMGGEWFEIPELTTKDTESLVSLVAKLYYDIKASSQGVDTSDLEYEDEEEDEEEPYNDPGALQYQGEDCFQQDCTDDSFEDNWDGYDEEEDKVVDVLDYMQEASRF